MTPFTKEVRCMRRSGKMGYQDKQIEKSVSDREALGVVGKKRRQRKRLSKDVARQLISMEATQKRMRLEAQWHEALIEESSEDYGITTTEPEGESVREADPIKDFWNSKMAAKYKAPQLVFKERQGEELLRRILGYFPNLSACAHAVVWKQDPHRREAKTIALQLDSLIMEIGLIRVRDSFVGEMMLRRFEALRVGNKSGDWSLLEAANETADFP